MFRLLPMILVFFGILSCKSVKSEDVTGTWVIKNVSRQVLPTELGKQQVQLDFRAIAGWTDALLRNPARCFNSGGGDSKPVLLRG